MKRILLVLVFVSLAGCSNAPVAGFLDTCFPSRSASPPPDRTRHPLAPRAGPNERISPPPGADLGIPVGPPAPGGN